MTHSPTPWNGMKLPVKYDPDNLAIMDARGYAIVAVESNQVEWAKAVCIAVNAHDDLVAVLDDVQDRLQDLTVKVDPAHWELLIGLVGKCRAARAKAGA